MHDTQVILLEDNRSIILDKQAAKVPPPSSARCFSPSLFLPLPPYAA